MKYFLLQEEETCKNIPRILNWYQTAAEEDIDLDKFSEVKDKTLLRIHSSKETMFTGVLTHPFLMIHEDIFEIINKYESGIPNKRLILLDEEEGLSQLYYLPLLRKLDCLSEKSVISNDKSKYKKIVLDGKKIKGRNIFWILGHASVIPIVNLDLAESILRRGAKGIQLTEVEHV